MRIVVVYRDASEHRLSVESFIRDYNMQTGNDIETINPDSIEGSHFCRLYDILQYPTVVAITDGGVLYRKWDSGQLPMVGDVATTANA